MWPSSGSPLLRSALLSLPTAPASGRPLTRPAVDTILIPFTPELLAFSQMGKSLARMLLPALARFCRGEMAADRQLTAVQGYGRTTPLTSTSLRSEEHTSELQSLRHLV